MGRDIEKKGMFGKADPYVKLTLGKRETKSATVKNNHNPEWNLKATFTVDQNTNEKLTIAVFDEDLGKDDSLGITSLDLSSIQNCRKLENEWIPLEKCKSGEILLSAEFIPSANIQTESRKKMREKNQKRMFKRHLHLLLNIKNNGKRTNCN